jgi:hypothetical protein
MLLSLQESPELVARIQAIPGWQSFDFLKSLMQQAQKGRSFSPRQLDALERFERHRAAPKPVPAPPRSAPPAAAPAGSVLIRLDRNYRATKEGPMGDIIKALVAGKGALVQDLIEFFKRMGGVPAIAKEIDRRLKGGFAEDSINAAEYADGAAEDGDGSENEGAPSESPIFRRYMAQELDKLVDKGLRCTWKETPSGVLFAYHPTYPDLIFDLTRQANRTATVRFRKEYDRRR